MFRKEEIKKFGLADTTYSATLLFQVSVEELSEYTGIDLDRLKDWFDHKKALTFDEYYGIFGCLLYNENESKDQNLYLLKVCQDMGIKDGSLVK